MSRLIPVYLSKLKNEPEVTSSGLLSVWAIDSGPAGPMEGNPVYR
jgi:hypothetical protein